MLKLKAVNIFKNTPSQNRLTQMFFVPAADYKCGGRCVAPLYILFATQLCKSNWESGNRAS
jgi:hypothetical protein